MRIAREASRLFGLEWVKPLIQSRSTSSTQRPNRSSSSRPWREAEAGLPSFDGQAHLLTDGRLDEAASLALIAAFQELGGAWRVRCERDCAGPGELVRLSVSLSLADGVFFRAHRQLDPARLRLDEWVPPLRDLLLACVDEVYQRLETELSANPQGQVARAVARQLQAQRAVTPPLALVSHCRGRLARLGTATLNGLDPQRGTVNLLAEIEADARAERLLANHLGPDYETVQQHGYLDIPSRVFPKRVYRVRRGQRIQILENGRCSAELCMEASLKVPDADEFLMKTVWLRANEEHILRTANHFPPARLLL